MGYGSIMYLQKIGLTNAQAPDMWELVTTKKKPVATFCSSNHCAGQLNNRNGVVVQVGVSGVNRCPICQNREHVSYRTIEHYEEHVYRARAEATKQYHRQRVYRLMEGLAG